MFFFLRPSAHTEYRRAGAVAGSGLLSLGLLCLLFGLIIFLAPEFLAYLIAGFFVIIGASLLGMWWRMRR